MLHRFFNGKSLFDEEQILWTSIIHVLSIAHHLRDKLSVLTWRAASTKKRDCALKVL